MEKLIIKSSRRSYFLYLFVSVGLVAVGVILLFRGNWFGLVPVIFFGSCAAVFVRQIIDSRPRLVIDERGVVDRTLGVGLIEWADIVGAYVVSMNGTDFICLELRDAEKYRPRLSNVRRAMASANRRLGFTDFSLNLSGVDANTYEVFELVMKFCEVSRREAGEQSGAADPSLRGWPWRR